MQVEEDAVQQWVLDAVEFLPGMTSTQLGQCLVGPKGGTYPSIVKEARDRLEDDGWIVRVRVPGHRTMTRWYRTDHHRFA